MRTLVLHPLTRRNIYIGLGLALLAFIVRLVFLYRFTGSVLEAGDQRAYWTYAEGIAAGLGFHSSFEGFIAFRPPFYSFFLAGIFRLYGENIGAVFVVETALWAAAAYWFYLCVVRLFGDMAGLFGGLCFVFLPHFYVYAKAIMTEDLYIPLLIAFIGALLIIGNERYKLLKWLWIGFLLGALALTRREAALPAGLILLAAVYFEFRPSWTRMLMALTLTGIVTVMMMAPWLIRNWGMLGSPVFSTAGGANLVGGNSRLANGGYGDTPPEWQAQLSQLDEVGQDKLAWDLSSNWIKENPGGFVALIPIKFATLWGLSGITFVDVIELLLIPFYIVGAIRLARTKENLAFVWIMILSLFLPITLLSLIFGGGWRFRLVAYPGFLLLAAYSVSGLSFKQITNLLPHST